MPGWSWLQGCALPLFLCLGMGADFHSYSVPVEHQTHFYSLYSKTLLLYSIDMNIHTPNGCPIVLSSDILGDAHGSLCFLFSQAPTRRSLSPSPSKLYRTSAVRQSTHFGGSSVRIPSCFRESGNRASSRLRLRSGGVGYEGSRKVGTHLLRSKSPHIHGRHSHPTTVLTATARGHPHLTVIPFIVPFINARSVATAGFMVSLRDHYSTSLCHSPYAFFRHSRCHSLSLSANEV